MGHCVAKLSPTDGNTGFTIGLPSDSPPIYERVKVLGKLMVEDAKDRSIKNIKPHSKDCPECGFPLAEESCSVCEGNARYAEGLKRIQAKLK